MDQKHFFPSHSELRIHPERNPGYQLEIQKGIADSHFEVVESCISKCEPDFTKNSEANKSWMKLCFNKFFNSQLLIQKEIEQYTHNAAV